MNRIIISRTDSIGDVILTLPLAGWLKKSFPESEIFFLARDYTTPVIQLSKHVSEVIDWGEISVLPEEEQITRFRKLNADLIIHVFPVREIAKLAKESGIPVRMGTTNRLYHWNTCNKLVRLSRRRSDLHEAQLNLKLVKGLTGTKNIPGISEIPVYYGLREPEPPDVEFGQLFDNNRFNLIIHPKSKGSAREWGIHNYQSLVNILDEKTYNVFITGTAPEKELLDKEGFFSFNRNIHDLTGKLDLQNFISLINRADGLVAGSTGPLHIAAALGRKAVGIYPPIRPMHPGRWAPLGTDAHYLVLDKKCNKCRKSTACECLQLITPEQVLEELQIKTEKP
jgi:ADP-heptose:LPS heptosyltransferase